MLDMKKKINLVGDTFTHLTNGNKGYSVHGKESKYIEWVKDGADSTFYIDNTINHGIQDDRNGLKYLWLLESKFIKPGLVESILQNRKIVEDTYEIIFTHDQRLLALGDKYKWVPAQGFWIKNPKICKKSKMISMISSNKNMCEGHRLRLDWVDRIGDQVDLYGRGFNEIANKEDGLCDYMFSIAIENGQYETYFTEKLLDCFVTGTIPVYLGAPDIGNHFNKDGIIDLTDEFDVSEEIYYNKMDAIKDNLERAKKMEVLEDFIYENYLKEKI
tara:strand:- start:6002 stop:6820 length:819 start_codon:yes stop_codon:yes gene_type:complete